MRCNKEEAAEGTKMKQATLIIVGNFFHFPRCASFGTVFIRPRKLSTLIQILGAKSTVMHVLSQLKKKSRKD